MTDKPKSWSEAMADEPYDEEHFTPEAIVEAVKEARLIQRGKFNVELPPLVPLTVDQLAAAISNLTETPSVEEETEYAVFNDPEVWEPLFTSGELPESQRFQLDEPLHTGASLAMIVKFIDLRNLERAQQGKVEKYGYMQLRTRTITRTPWRTLTFEEVDGARR